jgi:hypothetical protein
LTKPTRRALLGFVVLLATSPPAWGQAFDKQTLLRVLLATDARQVAACERLGVVSDTSPEDLRKKIIRLGGDAGLVTFDPADPDRMNAEVYRCQKVATPAPTPRAPVGGPTSALSALPGTWIGTVTGPPMFGGGLGGRLPVPTTVRVWEEAGQLRWKMDADTGDLNASGTVAEAHGSILFTGTYSRRAIPITYSLTLRGQVLEGSGVGADNVGRTLSLTKQP